jgi:hypothetical protein
MSGIMHRYGSGCIWQNIIPGPVSGSPDATWEFEILSETDAIVRLYHDGKTYVWRPVEKFDAEDRVCQIFERGFKPLCTSIFQFDPELSDDPGCELPECLCSGVGGNCCDSPYIRSKPLPANLHASLTFCCGNEMGFSDSFTITWNPDTARWEGSVYACGGTLSITVGCICGIESGCGHEPPYHCYQVKFYHSTIYPFEEIAMQYICECEPFELQVGLAGISEWGCSVDAQQAWELTILE